MKTAAEYLDAIREKHDLNSDRKAAALLGVRSASVSRFRNGEDSFSDETATKVAALLDCDPEEVMIAAHAQRAKDDLTRALWARLAKKAGYAGAIVMTTGAAIATPSPAHAALKMAAGAMCIMSTSNRRRAGHRPSPHDHLRQEKPGLSRLFFRLHHPPRRVS